MSSTNSLHHKSEVANQNLLEMKGCNLRGACWVVYFSKNLSGTEQLWHSDELVLSDKYWAFCRFLNIKLKNARGTKQ